MESRRAVEISNPNGIRGYTGAKRGTLKKNQGEKEFYFES